jgi:hypothetical protein
MTTRRPTTPTVGRRGASVPSKSTAQSRTPHAQAAAALPNSLGGNPRGRRRPNGPGGASG